MKIPLSHNSSYVHVEISGYWGWPSRAGRSGQVGQAGRVGLATHVRPPTLEGHNFFVQTLFQVILDSMESPLSQNFSHVLVEGSGYYIWPERAGRLG